MRLLAFLLTTCAWSQTVVKQGDVLRVVTKITADFARLNGRTIRLFPQGDGTRLGLMPIPVTEGPGTFRLEMLGNRQESIEQSEIRVVSGKFPTQDVQLSAATESLKPTEADTEAMRMLRSTVTETRFWTEPLARPVPGCTVSAFGLQRLHNGKPTGNHHIGLDLRGAAGTPVHATAAGRVVLARPFQVQGNMVALDHGQGLITMYLHLSGFAVKEGAQVQRDDVVGYLGSTGRSTAPHLHWSMNANGIGVNPSQWVRSAQCPAPKRKGKRRPKRAAAAAGPARRYSERRPDATLRVPCSSGPLDDSASRLELYRAPRHRISGV